MKSFIFRKQPKAYQGSKTFKSSSAKATYINELAKSLLPDDVLLEPYTEGDLYGVVYYFTKKYTGTDADNISKPIWDCLKGILYSDDKQIKLRRAGIFNFSENDFNVIDFSGIDEQVFGVLLDAFGTDDHFVYVECGRLDFNMFQFNIEQHGD